MVSIECDCECDTKEPNENEEPIECADIHAFTFTQTYLKYLQDDDVFFIKGVASDVNNHGREIKIIEDLKGNLVGKSSIFVWGQSSTSFCDNKRRQDLRLDDLTQYQKNDTLIMFIHNKVTENFNWEIERSTDYKTLGACASVLKLSNGYVTGYVNYWGVVVSWKELQEELQMLLKADEKPSCWSEEYMPAPFIIAYKGIYQLKDRPIEVGIPDFFNDYFFIQGLVLESYQNYGKRIQIINDLKGNFPKETTTFIVWGTSIYANDFSTRFDDLRFYNDHDTLFMLLRRVSRAEEIFSKNVEKQNDYSTLGLTFSVLKLSNNSVSGYINSLHKGEEIMQLEEFQELLK
jgi:hypothetical protein